MDRLLKFQPNKDEYPFRPHWFERDGCAMHYLDEGTGIPVVMLHGNPTWSFLYRNVIKQLSGECRSLVPDYPGFGLSEHPGGYGYTPEEHFEWIKAWIDSLNLDTYLLVVQDWGGPIGLNLAVDQPEKIRGIVIGNTWCWPADGVMTAFSLLVGGVVGRWAHINWNAFAKVIVPMGIDKKSAKSKVVLDSYLAPFQTKASRKGTAVFPLALRKSKGFTCRAQNQMSRLAEVPIEIVIGTKDFAMGGKGPLKKWRRLIPHANITQLSDANHYLQEDRPDAIADAVRRVKNAR